MSQNFIQQHVACGRSGRGMDCLWMSRFLSRVIRSGTAGRLAALLIFAVVLLAGKVPALAQDEAPMDYQVKAAFLVNFPKYVDWPATALPANNSPITVAIFGDDNVANEFEVMISEGKVVDGHPIVLKRITKEEEIGKDCQILFIGASEQHRTSAILERLKGSETLTVGESPDFLDKGGVINLVRQGRKVRLQVNLNAAKEAHLRISSRLLVVADVVKGASN